MTAVDDLLAWLRACLDDDERWARVARPAFFTVETLAIFSSATDAQHVIRHDPARVLREVEAKRQIIDEHSRVPWFEPEMIEQRPELADRASCGRCCTPNPNAQVDEPAQDPVDWPCPTLRLLALPYAAKPGYREEWAPEA